MTTASPFIRWRGWRFFAARALCAAIALCLLAPPSATLAARAPEPSATERKAVRAAHRHYRFDRRKSFSNQARHINPDGAYAALLDYWRGIFALRRGKTDAVIAYIAANESPFFAHLARRHLLEHYGKRGEWRQFGQFAAQAEDDCARALAALKKDGGDYDTAVATRQIWQADDKMNKTLCLMLYQHAHRAGILNKDALWEKTRALAGNRHLAATRRLLAKFPNLVSYRKVRRVVRGARGFINGKHPLTTRANRELVMISAMAAVRRHPKTAISRWHKFEPYFSPAENDHVWTHLAMWAARWHREDAQELFAKTSGNYDDEHSRAWRARAAMQASDWRGLAAAIDAMPEAESQLSAWRYWRVTAGQKTGELSPAAANQRLAALAQDEDDFYGLLAREATGATLARSPRPPPQIELARTDPDFELALAVHQAGLGSLARAIWRHTARRADVTDAQRLAAAQLAARANWHLASIDAANRATDPRAHHWRFPLAFKKEVLEYADKRGLDPAFLFGLIHQESRFMPAARSPARARGLMQVIPRTARAVARANGYSKYRLSRLTRVDTNMTIGTAYLQKLAKRLDASPAKVAAAYNAGPTRVRRWYSVSPELLVAIENLPLTETRLYVKYLLANRVHYNARLGRRAGTMQDAMRRPIVTAAWPGATAFLSRAAPTPQDDAS